MKAFWFDFPILFLIGGGLLAAQESPIGRRAEPGSASAIVSHARGLIGLGQSVEALLELNDLLDSSPDSVPALKLYAALLESALENRTKAEQVLKKCVKLAPSDSEAWQALGNLYLNRHRVSEAIDCFQTALRLSPDDPLLSSGLAMAYAQQNNEARAEKLFARAAELNQRKARPDPLVYVVNGEYLLYRNRAAESLPFFTRALQIDPQSANALFGRARVYEDSADWRHAEADALAALRRAPKRLDAHMLLLRIYRALDEQDKVEKYAALVTQLDEEEKARQAFKRRSGEALRLYLEEAEPLLRQQKYEDAIKICLRIIDLWPEFPAPLFELGTCYSQTGRPLQAIDYFAKYVSLRPDAADAHAALGILILQQGRNLEALKELELAMSLEPGSLEVRKAVASLHLSGGKPKAAARVLWDMEPTLDVEGRLMLADSLFQDRQFTPALHQVNRVLSAEPSSGPALKLKELILREAK